IDDTKVEEIDVSIEEMITTDNPSDFEEEKTIDDIPLESEETDTQEEMDVTKGLLFNSMVSQIHLSKNQLSSTQYEKLIVDHLHPGMSDHDYYTFVSLLIDHYIETKQFDELSSLITQNMSRFDKYPVI